MSKNPNKVPVFSSGKLKEKLPRGSVNKIAKKLRVSHALVSLVLSGKRENSDVIDAAIQIIAEHKNNQKALEKRIEEVLS